MIFKRAPEFEKELKTLTKRWSSLPKDLQTVELVIETLYVDQKGVDRAALRKVFFNSKHATILSQQEGVCEAVKMRVDCISLGRKDSVRLVFVYVFDGESVTYVEIYSKTDKIREDTARLKTYMPKT